ncbi:MAG: hypothetical protein AAFS10_02795, partial [Myxococcota bacterium]
GGHDLAFVDLAQHHDAVVGRAQMALAEIDIDPLDGGFRPADTPLKVGASLLMAALGAAIAPTVAYSLIDVARLYWNHLDAIESLVLFGDVHPDELTLEDPLEDMNDEDTPDGLYSWLADLDLDEFSEEDEEDEEEKPKRPGLLFLVHALDANTPFDLE